MIFDFGCHDTLNWDQISSAFEGALAVLAIVVGLAGVGRLFTRNALFQIADIFCGWGAVAAFMTLIAIFFSHILSYAAYFVFIAMLIGFSLALKSRYFLTPYWLLALFPGLLIVTIVNLSGVASWDDFTHWALNELYVFQYDGVPSRAVAPHFSMHPLYPYALPFLSFLASKLTGGLLVQGGAMMNTLFLLAFASMMVESTQGSAVRSDSPPLGFWNRISLTGVAFLFITLADPSFSTADSITNNGDLGTNIMTAALGLLFWRLVTYLKTGDQSAMKSISMQIALSAIAFVLVKEANIFLLGLLSAGFLIVAWKNGVLKSALVMLLIAITPAAIVRAFWQLYVNLGLFDTNFTGAGAYVFTVQPLSHWHFDQAGTILLGMRGEIMSHSGEFIMLAAVAGCGIFSLFRPSMPLRNFALLSSVVCLGYVVFLLLAYLGSSFNDYEIRIAASFARYMTHVGLLGMAYLWLAIPSLWMGTKEKYRVFVKARFGKISIVAGSFAWIVVLTTLAVHKNWLIPQPSKFMCDTRAWGHKVAMTLPDRSQLAIINPEGDYLFSRIVNFELAEEEARTGRVLNIPWHISIFSPTLADVRQQFGLHPETNALFYTNAGYDLLKQLGFVDSQNTFFMLREGVHWKSVPLKNNEN